MHERCGIRAPTMVTPAVDKLREELLRSRKSVLDVVDGPLE